MHKDECASTLVIRRKSNRFEIRALALVPGLPRVDGAAIEGTVQVAGGQRQ